MSNAIPPIMIQIAADVSQLKAGLAQAESSIRGMNTSVATANTGMQSMMGTAKKMAGTLGIAFAATQVVQFGKDVIMSASSMNESISKVNVVFGESADLVFKFGESAAKNMGMSNQAAIEAAGTYGNLFQAFGIGQGKANEMSTTLVQLAADLGSFNNTSTEDAINALRSGLSGETEPLKRFGVALNEVTLKNKAMAMGFGQIKGVMDPVIKAQVTYALVLEQTKLAQGDYARTADGTANTMKSLGAEFANAKVAIGNVLLPAFNALLKVLKVIIPLIEALALYFKNNADALKVLAIIVVGATAAFYAYKAAILIVKTTQQAYIVITTLMKGATLASIASTNGLAASMLKLNMVMRANPVGLIVTAIGLLAVGFVYAFNKFEPFRNLVISGAQLILKYWALLLKGVGSLLGALGKMPGMGWAKGIADGANNAAAALTKTADGLNKVKNAAAIKTENARDAAMSARNKVATVSGDDKAGGGAGESAAAAKKRTDSIAKSIKDVAGVYKDMNKVIIDSQDKVAEATKRRDEATAEANKQYTESVAKSRKQFNESIVKAENTFFEQNAAAYKRNKEQLVEIDKDYAKRTADIETKLKETLTSLREKAAEKSAEITQKANEKAADLMQKAAEKQQTIMQQSVDRLRSAFSSKTGFSLAEAFGLTEFNGAATGEQLLGSLKQRLTDAKNLATNAAALQGKGFSQTFIEQVVAAGPEVGNKLSKSILNASPETIKELNASFVAMEDVSNNGLDVLAKSMNTGANLATKELRTAYAQVAIDLKDSLLDVNIDMTKSLAEVVSDMTKGMAEANKNYKDAMAEAKSNRDEKMAEAAKDLMEALAEADKNFKESVVEIEKTLDEALAEAAKTLTETLAEVQKTYNEALDRIAKDTADRIQDYKDKLAELAATLNELGAKQAAINAIKNAPVYTPVVPEIPTTQAPNYSYMTGGVFAPTQTAPAPITVNNNVQVETQTNASPYDISSAVLSDLKYNTPIIVRNAYLDRLTGGRLD